jgi:hypothetical protein
MSKYDPLCDFLSQILSNVSEKTMTFREIEIILGFNLPDSAYNHRPWWANPSSPNDHPYAQAWLAAGWKVDSVNQNQQWVRFQRVTGLNRYSKTPSRTLDKTLDKIPVGPLPQITSRSIKLVIQCAGSKFENAGRLTTVSGEKVLFAAHPERYNLQGKCYRPDDIREGTGSTWRAYLESYNRQGSNPSHLFSAGDLAKAPVYKALMRNFGAANVFILSAGWGLVRSDYLLPYYDITFSNQGKPYSKRRPSDRFEDFNQLSSAAIQPDETIYFFGGQSYLPLYLKLTRNIAARKVIYHSHDAALQIQGYICIPSPYPGSQNWHYKCAQGFIDGMVQK